MDGFIFQGAKETHCPFFLGVDSPFFSTIILFNRQLFLPRVLGGFLERRIPGKNGSGAATPRFFSVFP